MEYQSQQQNRPPQHQPRQPGIETEMTPEPVIIRPTYRGSGKLKGKVALITGGDSGIGRSVAVHFAREGASIAVVYLDEDDDADDTKEMVEAEDAECLLIRGDVKDLKFCAEAVTRTVKHFGKLDILVNNAAQQFPKGGLEEISDQQLKHTFETNIYPYFAFSRAALPHLKNGGVILNTTSITAYRGSDHLLDYSATKGAIVAFTRSLAKAVIDDGVRVNGVAPGPIWTPLIPASFDEDHVEDFGGDTPIGRAGQPAEVAPAYVFLASDDGSYMVGQVLHPNGGDYMSS